MTEPIETFITYTADSWALDRTLRFFQAAFWTTSLIGPATYAAQSVRSVGSIHLTRRFLRAFKWAECWYNVFVTPDVDYGALHENVRMLKDSTLGVYFLLDMLVLPVAVGAVGQDLLASWVEDFTGVDGGVEVVEHTASVCWFYAIVLTLVLGVLELGQAPSGKGEVVVVEEKKKKKGEEKAVAKKDSKAVGVKKLGKPRSAVLMDLFLNGLDLLIPGTAAGYLKVNPVYVSIGMMTSSLITMNGIWRRIYTEKERANSAKPVA